MEHDVQQCNKQSFDVDEESILIGEREIYGGHVPVALSRRQLQQHTLVIGRSGSGKSTLLKRIIDSEITTGGGLTVVDPHGDLATDVIDVPSRRIDDIAFLDLTDREYPFAANLLSGVNDVSRHRVVDSIVATCRHRWRDSWGPRMEWILHNALSTLIHAKGESLLGVARLLTDQAYRDRTLRRVRDPQLLRFWQCEFEPLDSRQRSEAVSPILNKMGSLLSGPALHVLGTNKRTFDPRFALDSKRVLICNLAQGAVGATTASILGGLVVSLIYRAATSRGDITFGERVPHLLLVDEFPLIANSQFNEILSGVRKYGVGLVLALQQLDTLDPDILASLLGNVANVVCFGVGGETARTMARIMYGDEELAKYLSDQPPFHAVAKLGSGDPFSIVAKPQGRREHGTRNRVIQRSRGRFCQSRTEVDQAIARWLSGTLSPKQHRMGNSRKRR